MNNRFSLAWQKSGQATGAPPEYVIILICHMHQHTMSGVPKAMKNHSQIGYSRSFLLYPYFILNSHSIIIIRGELSEPRIHEKPEVVYIYFYFFICDTTR